LILARRHSPEFADLGTVERFGLIDRGDVRVTPSRITDAFERIEAAAKPIHDAGVIPITMGSDISLCHYFAPLPPRYAGMVAAHLDAHTDSYGYDPNDKYNATTQFTHAAEEQCIVASLSYRIGIRGTTYDLPNVIGSPHNSFSRNTASTSAKPRAKSSRIMTM